MANRYIGNDGEKGNMLSNNNIFFLMDRLFPKRKGSATDRGTKERNWSEYNAMMMIKTYRPQFVEQIFRQIVAIAEEQVL